MTRPVALQAALELYRRPSLAAALRRQKVPENVLDVIRIAANDGEAIAAAQELTGIPSSDLKAASIAFIEQAMFFADADHYRVLGLPADADHADLRRHMRWLMRWLHPDSGNEPDWEDVYVRRVLAAWSVLKDPEKRMAFDATLQSAEVRTTRRGRRRTGRRSLAPPWIAVPVAEAGGAGRPNRIVHRLAAGVGGLVLIGAVMVAVSLKYAPADPDTAAVPDLPAEAMAESR